MMFLHVVEAGSFTKAAECLYSSKSNISRKIALLEQSLDTLLLERTSKGISLTRQGQAFYQSCLEIKKQFEAAKQTLQSERNSVSGHIAVTAPMSLGSLVLGPLISKFLLHYPDISIELELSDHAKSLTDSQYDLAIRAARQLPDSNLYAKKLFTYDHVVAGAPDYFDKRGIPHIPCDLVEHSVITCITTHDNKLKSHWPFLFEGHLQHVKVNARAQVTHMWLHKQLALDGIGLIRVPRYWVQNELSEGKLKEVLSEYTSMHSHLYALYNHENKSQKRIRLLIQYLETHLPTLLNGNLKLNDEVLS